MPATGHALGVDFGTSNTVAVLCGPDGRCRPLLVDGSPLLPSAVYADPSGALVAGRDALHDARSDPARCEPNPKRHLDEESLDLGGRPVSTVDAVAAVLGRVAEEALRAAGERPAAVTLTCPATWGPGRRQALSDAAERAGLGTVRLVAEPVAAASYFVGALGRPVPVGSAVVVYDLGAGTFDASVVLRTPGGFRVRAVDGRADLGGLDLDAAIVAHLGVRYGQGDPPGWARLSTPRTVEDRRARTQLWDEVRVAKERLSRVREVELPLPILDVTAHLARDEWETLARPLLERTVRITRGAVRWAGARRLSGVFLVGGASRMPLVARMLHDALGESPTVVGAPELVVAEGSVSAPGEPARVAPDVDFTTAPPEPDVAPGPGRTPGPVAAPAPAAPAPAAPAPAAPAPATPAPAPAPAPAAPPRGGPGSGTTAARSAAPGGPGSATAARPTAGVDAEAETADLGGPPPDRPTANPGWPARVDPGWPPARPAPGPGRPGAATAGRTPRPAGADDLPAPPRPPVPVVRAPAGHPVHRPPQAPPAEPADHPVRRMLLVVFLAVVLTALPLVAGYVTFRLTLHQPLLPISFDVPR